MPVLLREPCDEVCYDTAESSVRQETGEALERSSGMTLSRKDLVLSVRVRSVVSNVR